MEKRKHILIQAYTHLSIGTILVILLIIYQPEFYFLIFGLAFIGYSVYKTYTLFKELQAVSAEEKVTIDPMANASVDEKIRYYKRMLFLGIPAFIVLSGWTAYDLNTLEAGEVESVSIWGPLALLYESCGYWVAVLCVPLLGIFTISSLGRMLYILKRDNPS